MMLPFIGIGQITILNDNLIKQKFPNEIAGLRDIDRLTRDDPNFSGAFTVDVLYFEGEEFKSNGVFIDYYVDEEDEDGIEVQMKQMKRIFNRLQSVHTVIGLLFAAATFLAIYI